MWRALGFLSLALAIPIVSGGSFQDSWRPMFELVQPELFSAIGGQASAWADVDGDGDLDYFVAFRGRPNRLYRNDNGTFSDVAAEVGLADDKETRAAAWGDYDADGDVDVYIGFADPTLPAKVYRNEGKGAKFVNVAHEVGLDLKGVSRQPAWIDYDGDGDLDLFAAFRDVPNRLFRNDGDRFVDVTSASGIGDPRKTVSGVWWDFDRDGDVDLFVANQEGDANGLYRQDHGHFEDVAAAMDVSGLPRPKEDGGVGPSVADFDLDGDFDLFVANYGTSALYRNDGGKSFTDIARASGINLVGHGVTSAWGDIDNDGLADLYVGNYIAGKPHYRDALFHNMGPSTSLTASASGGWRFAESLPELLLTHDATHGVQFVDFDRDGRIDLSLTNNDPDGGGHPLLRNTGESSGRGFLVEVTDAKGRLTKAGSEVRVFAAGSSRLLTAGIVDAGSGYCSQNAMPVHLGVPRAWTGRVDVEVTSFVRGQRRSTKATGIDIGEHRARPLRIAVP
jgi:hypothetical protein